MALPHSVFWNRKLRLALSDVDETVADLYRPAELLEYLESRG